MLQPELNESQKKFMQAVSLVMAGEAFVCPFCSTETRRLFTGDNCCLRFTKVLNQLTDKGVIKAITTQGIPVPIPGQRMPDLTEATNLVVDLLRRVTHDPCDGIVVLKAAEAMVHADMRHGSPEIYDEWAAEVAQHVKKCDLQEMIQSILEDYAEEDAAAAASAAEAAKKN